MEYVKFHIMDLGKEIAKMLIDKDMRRTQLAKALGIGYSSLTNAINGYTKNAKALDILIKAHNYLKSLP